MRKIQDDDAARARARRVLAAHGHGRRGHRGAALLWFAMLVLVATYASAGSLPVVASGARPGPDVLYAPAPAAPQLENRNPRFQAPPLLVSGQEAYVAGEYLYQDFLY